MFRICNTQHQSRRHAESGNSLPSKTQFRYVAGNGVKTLEAAMAWLDVRWGLNAWRFNERDDEQGLHFALVTVMDGTVNVHAHKTGDLSSLGHQMFHGRIRSQQNVPSSANPYLGIVVRGIEYDSSSGGDRTADYERFETTIATGAQEIVNRGAMPSTSELQAIADSAGLKDRRLRDDDDRIGVWTWVDPIFGQPVTADYDSAPTGNVDIFYSTTFATSDLVGEGAEWKVAIYPMVKAGSPGTNEEWVTQQHAGAGWMDWGGGSPAGP